MNSSEDIVRKTIETMDSVVGEIDRLNEENARLSKLVDADQAAYIKELEEFVIEFNYAPRPLMGPSDYAKALFARIESRRAKDSQGGDA